MSDTNHPETLTLYKPDDHNRGVVTYNFTFKCIVKDDNGDCYIYSAPCPYEDGQSTTTSLSSYKHSGYLETPEEAHNACIKYQKEDMAILKTKLAAAEEMFNNLNNAYVLFYTPKKID